MGKKVVVLWDFTDTALNALMHGEIFAKSLSAEIELLHIVSDSFRVSDAKTKMLDFINCRSSEVSIVPAVEVGNIFETISEYVNKLRPELVVLGTHGIVGMQKFSGSWALKVIVGTKVPVLVISNAPQKKSYDKVVFPITFKKENKELISLAILFNKLFSSKIYLFVQDVNDSFFLQQVNNNILFATKQLSSRNVKFEIKRGSGNHFEEIVEVFSRGIEADMILCTTTKNINNFDYMFGATEQKLLANDSGIPVMCINPFVSNIFSYSSLY